MAYEHVSKTYESVINSIRASDNSFSMIAGVSATALTLLSQQYGYPDVFSHAYQITIDGYGHQSDFFPEARQVLEQLLTNGVKMVVASDNDQDILAVQRSRHNLDKHFSAFCISEDARAYKPSLGFLERLNKHLPGDTGRCYFIGDTPFDIECGVRLGINSVLIARNNSNATSTSHVIHNLKEFIPMMGLK